MTYRPDIDGLRALAVGAVMLYHAGVPGFSGGYVGVDVFFVISGYLITRLLSNGTTLGEFYIRRSRRILPALFVLAAVVTVPAALILLPWDLKRFGQYVAAAPVFLGNVPPWIEGNGYFDSRSGPVALTHLWSIAVEEQFYLVYPLVLYLSGRHRLAAIITLGVASLALCVWASYYRAVANFFLAPPRAWELLLGALVASVAIRWQTPLREALAGAALLTLAYVIYTYTPLTRYPGAYTLAPCLATAVSLSATEETVVGRLLSLKPLVFTGLISYSLYLWHYPILVLVGYYNIVPFGPWETTLMLALIFGVATLSWQMLEKPVRYRAVFRSDRAFTVVAIAIGVAVLSVGVYLWKADGLAARYSATIIEPDQNWVSSSAAVLQCVNKPIATIAAADLCSYGPQDDGAPKALVWGDSHAMVTLPAYEKLATSLHVRIYYAVKPACRPLLGVINKADSKARQTGCTAFNAAVVQAIQHLQPRVVILNAHWIDPDANLVPQQPLPAGTSHFQRALKQTLGVIHAPDRETCALLDVPYFKYNIPHAVAMSRKRGISEDFLKVSRAEADAEYHSPEADMRSLQQLRTVDLKDSLCKSESNCAYEAGGKLLYVDKDHLSVNGALYIADTIAGCWP